MPKPKMIVKGVSFNPNSKRHMELFEWVQNQHKNFSAFARELIAIEYEKSKQGNNIGEVIEVASSTKKEIDSSMI